LATARANYQEVLRDEPANRDALLGLAAIDGAPGVMNLRRRFTSAAAV